MVTALAACTILCYSLYTVIGDGASAREAESWSQFQKNIVCRLAAIDRRPRFVVCYAFRGRRSCADRGALRGRLSCAGALRFAAGVRVLARVSVHTRWLQAFVC